MATNYALTAHVRMACAVRPQWERCARLPTTALQPADDYLTDAAHHCADDPFAGLTATDAASASVIDTSCSAISYVHRSHGPQTVVAEVAYSIQKLGDTDQELLFLQMFADGDLALVDLVAEDMTRVIELVDTFRTSVLDTRST